MLKRMLRFVLELPAMSWARVGIFLLEATRERQRLRRTAEAIGLSLFDSATFEVLKNLKPDATTAFILGTGASAADLSAEKLAYIESQFSIGVNQWILHPMVPDVYAYEVDPDVRLLQALDRMEVREKSPLLLFLKPSTPEGVSNASFLPEFMREKSFLYSRVNIWTRKKENIARDVAMIRKRSVRSGSSATLLDDGASIARMVFLCLLLGYKSIVLVGVDLNSVEYFWHRNPALLGKSMSGEVQTSQDGPVHETLSTRNRPFPIDVFLEESLKTLKLADTALEVEFSGSALARFLEVFSWPTRTAESYQ